MTMRSWIRNLFTRPAARTVRRAARGFRPSLEVLEDRAVPATFTVLNSLDDGSVGSLRWAVTQANSTSGPDTINFGDGSATGGTNFLDGSMHTIILGGTQLELSNTTGLQTITGPAAGVTVSGGGLSREFQIDATVTASISGLTITDGKSTNSGGGLYNLGTTTLTDCTVSGNSTTNNGGGIYNGSGISNGSGTITFTDCTISGNQAGNVGAGVYSYGGTTTLTNCTVSSNTATSQGGGLDFYAGTATLTNCTVRGNSAVGAGATGGGGGLWLQTTTNLATLTNCTISGNSASGAGGGLLSYSGTATLTNCTVSGNSAGTAGGGLRLAGTVTLTNCTVSNNSAAGTGAVGGGGGLWTNGPTTIGNTIVAENTADAGPDAAGTIISQGHNLIGTPDGSSGWVSSDLTGTTAHPRNSLLSALGNYGGPTQTMALLPGSPAIDAGSNALIPTGVTTDQRGDSRLVNSTVDIGAFESNGFTIAVTSGSGQSTSPNAVFSAALVATVTPNNPIEPVAGGLITFTPPASGASATINGNPATISGTGTASVTATANSTSGSYSVSATASGITSAASFSLNNNLAPTFAALSPAAGTAGAAYTGTIGISNGTGPFSLVSTTLPTGYNAVLSGSTITVSNANPSAATVNFTVTIKDASGGSFTSGSETLTVKPAPIFAALSPAAGTAGVAYAGTIGISNGTPSFSLVSTTLPTGYNAVLNGSTITVSNANPSAATVNFTVTIKDASGGSFTSGSETLTVKPAPIFAALSPAAGTAGVAYTGTIGISNGTPSFSLVSTTLPTGYNAVLNGSTITVSNANPSAATVNFTVTIKDASGGSFTSGSETLTVDAAPSFAALSPAVGTAGAAYTGTIGISNGTGPFSLFSTTLPTGYNAVLNGSTITVSNANPSAATVNFTVTIKDASGGSFTSGSETLTVNPVPVNPVPTFAALSPAAGTAGVAYTGTIGISNGTGPFSLVSTTLPTGYNAVLNGSTITVSNTNPSAAAVNFTVTIKDASGGSFTSGSETLTVNSAPTFAALSPAAGTAGVAYTGTIGISNGTPAFSLVSTTLPTGYNAVLNGSTITVSNTNPSAAAVNFTVTIKDASGGSFTSGSETLTVNSAPTFAALSPAAGTAGVAYTGTIGISNGTPSFSLVSTTLPTGYNAVLNGSTITVSNANPSAATVNFTVTIKDASGGSFTSGSETLTVKPAPIFAALSPAAGTAGVAYTGTIGISNGTPSFSLVSTTLPTGYNAVLNGSTITVSNANPSAATVNFTVTIKDASGGSFTSGSETLTVNPVPVNPVPTFAALSPAAGTAGEAYTGTIGISNGTPAFSLVSTTLPTGYNAVLNGSTITVSNANPSAATVNFTVTIKDASGSTFTSGSETLTVNPKTGLTQIITFGTLAKQTYGVAPITLSASASSGLAVTYAVVSGPATVSANTLTVTGAGTVEVEASQAGNAQYQAAAPVFQSFTVAKAALTITADSDSKTYDTLKAFSATAFTETGLVTANGDTITGVIETSTGAPVSAPAATDPIVASAATGTGLSNYTISYVSGKLTVNKAALTITANSASKTYGTLKTFSATAFTETGLLTGSTITGVTETSTGAPVSAIVGGYNIVASAATGTGLSNYTIQYISGTLTVNKATLTITANSDSKSYGTLKTFSSTAFTETGLVTANGDTITGVSETSTGTPGSAPLATDPIVASAATGKGLSNYTISYVNGTLTVNKATLTITANSVSKTYGTLTTFSSTAFTQTGLATANGDTITGVTETSTGTPVSATAGGYSIAVSAASGNGLSNYTIKYVNGTLTVNKAALTITANDDSKTYGTLKSFSATAPKQKKHAANVVSPPPPLFTETGLVTANGDTISGVNETSTGAPVSAPAATYSIVASAAAGTGLSNYTISYVSGTLTVNKEALTITANSASKTYGTLETFSATAFTETGLMTGDTITGVTETSTGAPGSAPAATDPIAVSAATGKGLSNYTISYVTGTLTINKAALTITASSASKTYGTLKTFSATAYTDTGLVTADGDTITGVTETSTGAPVAAPVATDPIVASAATGKGLSNYTISYVSGKLTVNKAALTITAKSDSKTAGTLKTFGSTAFTQTGLVTANGDTITAVTETSTGTPVAAKAATYPIVASAATGTGLSNYTISYVNGTLTVNPATPGTLGTTALLEGPATGSDSDIVVASGSWGAKSNASWLTTTAGATGNGVAAFTFAANTGATRSGTLTIAGKTLTVTQAGSTYVAANPLTTLVSGLNAPIGVAVDGSGNVYFADSGNTAIKEWKASTQTVSTLVSGLHDAIGVAVDSSGNVYFADNGLGFIGELHASTQTVTTLVSGLNGVEGVAVDGSGNVYFASDGFGVIVEWHASTQALTTLALGLNNPVGVAVDAAGNVYFADSGDNAIEEWNASTQTVSTLVSGLNRPVGVAVDGSGNVYFADSGNNAIKEWNASTQTVSTLVSSGLNTPSGVAVDGSGNVYLADYGNNAIKELPRAFVPGATVSEGAAAGSAALLAVLPATESLTGIFAPSSSQSWLTIGTIANGVINFSFSSNTALPRTADLTMLGQTIAVTQTGSLPLASSALLEGPGAGSDSDLVVTSGAWKATSNASWLHTSASGTGNGVATFTFDFNTGATRSGTLTIAGKTLTVTQAGSTYVAANALTTLVSGLNDPADVAVDTSGNIYLVATNVLEEWHASTSHTVSSLVSGLINPEGVAVDGSGNVYIASDGVISEWHASTHAISTLYSGIDPLSGLAVDAAGNVYFSDIAAVAIDEWHASTQTVSTLVSSGLVVPLGVAVDAAGNVYIADNSAKTIDEWNASTQKLSTLVSFLTAPEGVAVDGSGNVYIADQFSYPNPTQIQEWNASTQTVSTLVSSGLGNPSGVAVDASGNVYISDNGTNAIEELPRAFLPGAVSEGSAAESGALPAVLPTTQSLTGVFAPTSDQSWLTIGTIANGVVNFTVTANPSITPRIADITLLGQQITVTQAGATITTGNSLLEGPAAGSASHVVATTGAWKATANATWLHTTASGTGKGLATFTFDANTGAPRVGTLTIAGQTLTVIQAGSTDVADNQLTALASTGVSSADGLAVDASGNIYISDLGAEAIKEFNASTKTVTTLVSGLGNLNQGNPHGVAVDGSGNVYFINGNDLDEWHASTQTVSILVSSGLSGPSGLALDASGNVYIADSFNVAIKEWHASTKTVTTLVSGFEDPCGVAVDAAGNVYIADQGGTIDEWHASTQQLTTLVSGLDQPTAVAVDASGNVYISDPGANIIEEWHASTQHLSTLLSASGLGLAVDASGNLYIAYGNVTELNASTQTLSTLVNSSLSSPSGVAVDVLGNVYIADTGNDAFEEWNASTQLRSTLASSGLNPSSVAVDGSGNVYITEYIAGVANTDMLEEWNASTKTASAINTLSYNNITYTNNGPTGQAVFDTAGTAGLANDEQVLVADNGGTSLNGTFFVGNITPTTFELYFDKAMTKPFTVEDDNDLMAPGGYLVLGGLADPQGVAVDAAGNVYIADSGNNAVKEWNASTKAFTTLVSAGLNSPAGVAVDAAGNVYIADTGDNAIKEWNASTKTVSILISGLNQPGGVAVDAAGNVYIADSGNNEIQEWNASTKTLSTLIAGLNDPRGVAVDGSGNVYIADTGNNAIEELPRAFLPGAVTEGSAAGSDQLQVLSTTPLTGVFAPTSNQSWLKVGAIANGVVNFSFSANTTTAARTAQLTVLGQQITVTQQLTPAFSNLSSATIPAGNNSATISGQVAVGTLAATGSVVITITGANLSTPLTSTVSLDASGKFSTVFPETWAAGTYTVSYQYAGDQDFNAITPDGSTTLVVS